MEKGHILRLGRIADDKLTNEFGKYLTLDGIVERLAVELRVLKQNLEDQIAGVDSRAEPARQTMLQFERLDDAEGSVASMQEAANVLAMQREEAERGLAQMRGRREELFSELRNRRRALLAFLRRSEGAIQADILKSEAEILATEARTRALNAQYFSARESVSKTQLRRDELRNIVEAKDRSAIQRSLGQFAEERAKFVSELRDVEAKLAALRNSVIREAKVIGATCTKAYLSHGDVGQVDVVVIDEASMVILPVAWFVAGLAKERVVVSGDFRQLPPIVPTDQEAIHEILGKDVFEACDLTSLDDPRLVMLEEQHRMHPDICDLIAAPMYKGLLRTAHERQARYEAVLPAPFDQPLTIIDTSDLWPFEGQTAFFSRFNMLHALLVRNLTWDLKRREVLSGSQLLGICTPYAAQSRMIHKLLQGEGLDGSAQVGTVHSYQGDERKIILLDIPESHGGSWALGQFVQGLPPTQVGARLINVAVSRAVEHLVVLANLTYLDKKLPSTSLLRDILFRMQDLGRVIPGGEILKLRPIAKDLEGLIGQMDFDEVVNTLAIFDEHQFERALLHDVKSAQSTIVIFSGYVTSSRVSKMIELLRLKILEGVKVRCVTRPPRANGSIPEASGREAIEMLESIGVVVDCRANIHQKVCLVDNGIVWWGSLNALSHMYHADETMTRAVNSEFAAVVASHLSKRRLSSNKAASAVADAENPRCPDCSSRTVLGEGRYGSYFYCEASCGWKQSLRAESLPSQQQEGDLPKSGPACPRCGKETRLKRSTYGFFYSCVDYPKCGGTTPPPRSRATRKTKTSGKMRH